MIDRMYEIKNLKYECVYSPEVVKEIQELVNEDYSPDECLDFIDQYGEEAFLEHYVNFGAFEYENPKIDLEILIEYYSGFDFLYHHFYGEYKTKQAFIEHYYVELDALPPIIMIDWNSTISYVEKIFDFVPTKKNTFYVLSA